MALPTDESSSTLVYGIRIYSVVNKRIPKALRLDTIYSTYFSATRNIFFVITVSVQLMDQCSWNLLIERTLVQTVFYPRDKSSSWYVARKSFTLTPLWQSGIRFLCKNLLFICIQLALKFLTHSCVRLVYASVRMYANLSLSTRSTTNFPAIYIVIERTCYRVFWRTWA